MKVGNTSITTTKREDVSLFVTVEGIDGAGKSTVVEALEDHFGDRLETTQEPSELWTGKQVRRALSSDDTDPLVDFFLFMADRVHHIEKEIKPALKEGKIVVSDRYADSTRAYQRARINGVKVRKNVEEWIETVFGGWSVEPDLTIYIDIPVDVALSRIEDNDKYENGDMLSSVRHNYERLYEGRDDVVWIDGTQDPEVVKEVAVHAVEHAVRRRSERELVFG